MTQWRNWSGSVVANPAAIARPRDEAELAAIVRDARQVRVTGAGHSFMPLCETKGTLISLADMVGDLIVAADRRSVDAPAGWSLKRLTEALWAEGLSLPNQGDVNPQSLAGALSTGTHGTGRDLGSLATLARSFRLVTADGSVVDCDAVTLPDLFQAQRLSLGMLGVVTRVRIAVIPALHLEERIERRPLAEVLDRLPELAVATRHMEFFQFPYSDTVTLKTLHPTDATELTREEGGDQVFQACCDLAAAAPRAVPMIQRTLSRLIRPSRRAGPAWRIFPSERQVRFEEMEYELPVANAVAALRESLALLRSHRMPLIFPFEFRMVAADDIWLSPFHAGPCASISVHQYAPMPWARHFAELEAVFRAHGGRPHWAKRHTLTSDDVRTLYPNAEAFGDVRRAIDPEGKFMNDDLRRLFNFSL
ncbi:FAD-linked oxidoreductase [Sphingomonas sp. Leaf412]|uniref:D-arabinono-1,4-lactone oxidase n=1 Tax=Sphingomonas sp. Leaf412 TaxID=1736370 RepID=UPI0006F56794|nr:D-arabinono-1,4-lactone oxidase [Sphingomonas sp. Leaf412]KQT32979.1 FAD-linked oxidoreductase [Sphingomonas sp. Leaf412]